MKRTSNHEAPVVVPPLGDLSGHYGRIDARYQELTARQAVLIADIGALVDRMRATSRGFDMPRAPEAREPAPPARHVQRATELLGDLAEAPQPPAPEPEDTSDVAELRKLGDELDGVREALRLMAPRLEAARAAASKELAAQLRPAYSALAERLVDALVELGSAVIEHQEFEARLIAAGARIDAFAPLISSRTPPLGLPQDPLSPIRKLIEGAIERGHVAPSILPPGWLISNDALVRLNSRGVGLTPRERAPVAPERKAK